MYNCTDTMTRHYYFVFICHRYIDAPLHERSTFHIIFLIITCLLGTQLCHVYTSRFHLTLVLHVHEETSIACSWNTYIFTSIHAWLVFIFLSYGSLFMLHVLLFHVTVFMLYDCFPVADIVPSVPGYMICWYTMCGFPHLLFPVSCYHATMHCSSTWYTV